MTDKQILAAVKSFLEEYSEEIEEFQVCQLGEDRLAEIRDMLGIQDDIQKEMIDKFSVSIDSLADWFPSSGYEEMSVKDMINETERSACLAILDKDDNIICSTDNFNVKWE